MTAIRSGEKQGCSANPEEAASAMPNVNQFNNSEAPIILPYGGMATGHYPTELGTQPIASKETAQQAAAQINVQRRDSVMSTGSSFGISGGGTPDDDNEDSDDDGREKRSGRRKIRIEYIEDKSRRHITFSKRKAGIMKKVDDKVSP